RLKKEQKNTIGNHPTEEEAYIILKGKALLSLGDEKKTVKQGQVVYVPAGVTHQFSSLTDDFEYIYAATWPHELKKKNK
ncbi:MAG: cupin domain-containing protein, partial [Candidatus Firestonebacteria bacterium]